jgi:glycosyltransferase involved in cell wall biosynthesis
MRIGIDARLVFYSKAGIGQYIMRLAQSLAQIQPEEDDFVLLQSRKDKTSIVNDKRFARMPLWTPSHHPLEQYSLRFELSTKGLDLLHSPDFIPPFNMKCKSVITIHDLAFLLYPHFLTRESARYYGQIDQAVRRTDHIIAVSEATKNDIVKLLGVPEKKITVIHEAANPIYKPVDRQEAYRHVAQRYAIPERYILFVSTIEPRKNLPILLKAFRLMIDHYKSSEALVLAGAKGWLSEEVFSMVDQLQLSDRVHFLGRIPSDDLLYLYNAAQFLVHPSLYEGFGLPPLEAMTCGTPVIVSNISAMPEVVGDAAIMVDPHDVDGLSVAMWRLLTDETQRKNLVELGLQRAQQFSWLRAARQTLSVYHKVGK